MTRSWKIGLSVGAPATLVLCGVFAPYYGTAVVWELRKLLPVLAAVVVTAVVTLTLAAVGDGALGRLWHQHLRPGRDGDVRARSRRAVRRYSYGHEGRRFTLGALGFVVGGGLALLWVLHTHYLQSRTYLDSLTVSPAPLPAMSPRAPYQVGVAQARPNLGDTAGDIADTTYLPVQERFTSLVNRRGWLSGYEVAFSQQIPLQGRGNADQKCTFDRNHADARVDGVFGHNLARLINDQRRWVRFDPRDVYAYCDGNRPVVVVPLKRQSGTWVVVEKPAGVARYDGLTGRLHFTSDTRDLPGPSYPLSLAATQRAATGGMGSFTDWLARRVGWETPDDDVNSGNDSEFALASGGQALYVTPMTGRGSATAISAVSTVPARHPGLRWAPLTVYRLDPVWVSPAAIVDRIRADYQDIPNWQTINVYEVVPTGPNSWVATLGTGQNILYRASGTGDLKGGQPTCLLRADGSTYRCGTLAGVDGNGVGGQYGPGAGPTATPVPGTSGPVPAGDLRGLSDAQLAELQRRVAEETACRLAGTCPRK